MNGTGRVVLGWALVGVPLVYGVIETLARVSKLFAG
ncbi:MFS transporter small subunit [Kineococcus rubinsiae]